MNKNESIIFSLTASQELGKIVSKKSGIQLGRHTTKKYADGEIFTEIHDTVRGRKVFVIQSTNNPANDHIMELLIFIDALKRASAKEINLIIPYYGYARQDRITTGRQSITSKLVAKLLEESGADRMITFDLHSPQSQGFFNIPTDNLNGTALLVPALKKVLKGDYVVVAPDHGAVGRARKYAIALGNKEMAVLDKRRSNPNEAEAQFILGNVKGKDVLIVDDMVDTAGTISSGVKMLKKEGAKKVYVAVTHPVLSGTEKEPNRAIDRMKKAGVEKFFTTNTIAIKEDDFIHVEDIGKTLSDVIKAHLKNESLSVYFDKKLKIKEAKTTEVVLSGLEDIDVE